MVCESFVSFDIKYKDQIFSYWKDASFYTDGYEARMRANHKA
jgi:hypothetical protein